MKNRNIFLYGLFFIFFICVHSVMQIKGDGLFFSHLLDDSTLRDVLIDRWNTWSSRLIIESVMFYVSRSLWVWRMLDSLILVVLVWALNHIIFKEKNSKNLLLTFLCVLVYPFSDMSTASFCATTLNYLWPLTFLLVALIPLVETVRGRTLSLWLYPLFLLFALFASNHEQVACVLVLLGCVTIPMYRKYDYSILYPSLLLVVGIANAIIILLCPGNGVRTDVAIPMCYDSWAHISIFEKAYLSISSLATIVANNFIIFGLFIGLGGYGIIKQYQNRTDKIMVLSIILVWFVVFLFRMWCIFSHSDSLFFCYETRAENPFDGSLLSVSLLLLGLYIIASSLWMVIRLWRDDYWIVPLCIIIVGLASRLMMGLSPTIFVSARRTMIYFYFSLLIVILLMIRDGKVEMAAKYRTGLIIGLAFYSLAKYASMMYMVANEIGTLGIA